MSTPLSRLQLRLTKFEVIITSLLLFLPLILMIIDGGARPSISNYAYMDNNHWYVSLITISAMMFTVNGVYINKHWYNILLGASLFGVGVTPHLDLPIIHNLSAFIFFAGSIFVMCYYSNKVQRKYMYIFGILIIFGMIGHYVFGWYSLFVAEWIGLTPISLHFIGESLGKID